MFLFIKHHFIMRSPNSLALRADYIKVVKDTPIISVKYRLPITFGRNWPTQQYYGLFPIAKVFVMNMHMHIGYNNNVWVAYW